jgi:hypothetical protein
VGAEVKAGKKREYLRLGFWPHTRSSAPAADLQVSAEVAGEAQRLVKVEHLEPARAHRR